MKKFIALLLIGILLISCGGCTNTPEFGDDSDIAMSEDDDGVDIQAKADDSMKIQPENNTAETADVPQVKTVKPEPKIKKEVEIKKEPEPYNLNYTVKHDDSNCIYDGYAKDNTPEFPIVYVIDSVQKLSQVISDTVRYKLPEKIKYREKTQATTFDYTKAKKEVIITEYYNDAFFENKILVLVISKLSESDIVADLNSVKSDGTVQIDLLNSSSYNIRPYNYSCCEYIELDKKYAGLDFEIKYNEVPIDTSIDTRDLMPIYPNSINFKVKQFDTGGCSAENKINCLHNGITVIKSVDELQDFIDNAMEEHWNLYSDPNTKAYDFYDNKKNNEIDAIDVYAYNNNLDFVNNKISKTNVVLKNYYNEKFFKTKSIVLDFASASSISYGYQVRSITPDGLITYEYHIPSGGCLQANGYSWEFIEIYKKYENLDFKTEVVTITNDEYKWKY